MALTEEQRLAQRKWREKNIERVKIKNKEAFHRWYEKNKEEHNRRALKSYHKRRMEATKAQEVYPVPI